MTDQQNGEPDEGGFNFRDNPDQYVLAYLKNLAKIEAEVLWASKHGDLPTFSARRREVIERTKAFDDVWRAYVIRTAQEFEVQIETFEATP